MFGARGPREWSAPFSLLGSNEKNWSDFEKIYSEIRGLDCDPCGPLAGIDDFRKYLRLRGILTFATRYGKLNVPQLDSMRKCA
jgi:hypothetical protein